MGGGGEGRGSMKGWKKKGGLKLSICMIKE